MSTSFMTPDSGYSHPHTPSCGQPPSGKFAKSSLVGKVTKYHVPENCKEYQEFSYDPHFILEPLRNHDEFLEFLDLDTRLIPETVPDVPSRGKGSFLELANKLAKCIQQFNVEWKDPDLNKSLYAVMDLSMMLARSAWGCKTFKSKDEEYWQSRMLRKLKKTRGLVGWSWPRVLKK